MPDATATAPASVAAPSAAPQSSADKVFAEHLGALLDGSKEPKNDTVAYFVKSLAEHRAQYETLAKAQQQGEQQLRQAQLELFQLSGTIAAEVNAIRHFEI